MAQRIIDCRRDHQEFKSIDELVLVKGVGQKTLEKLQQELIVKKE